MDDGFQHRRLARDIDIVTIDASEPFGYGRLLPAGLLREPLGGLRRAHAVVLTRCDQVPPRAMDEIESIIRKVNPSLILARSAHTPSMVRLADGSQLAPAGLKDKKVFAFCGIGNPEGFLRTVESCGCRIVGKHIFDDHQAYSNSLVADLHTEAKSAGAELVLTTQKDWTKISQLSSIPSPPYLSHLSIELQFTSGGEALTALIDRTLADRIPRS
jgi:tetraacyldisaccharide 4'-kinase